MTNLNCINLNSYILSMIELGSTALFYKFLQQTNIWIQAKYIRYFLEAI